MILLVNNTFPRLLVHSNAIINQNVLKTKVITLGWKITDEREFMCFNGGGGNNTGTDELE